MEARLRSRRPRRHHEIQAPGYLGERRIKDLPEPPSNRVARHRVSHPPGDGETQAGRIELVGESMNGEQFAPVRRALPVNPFELRRVGQPCAFAPRQRSDGQPLPPAPAPGGDDPSTPDRTHALAKTVRFCPLAPIRLVRTLHGTPLLTGSLKNPREYIRSPRSHPAPEGKVKRSPTYPPARARSMGKRCKTSTNCDNRGCTVCENPLSGSISPVFPALVRSAFQAVIHSLWISLWITTLMSCKIAICFQTL